MANRLTAIGGEAPTNGAAMVIEASVPYVATVRITGIVPLLFHAWNCEAVEAKSVAAKGSRAKKTDDIETYVYRCEDGMLGLPGNYLTGSICNAAKSKQDPRSPRKSAMDLYKAGVSSLTLLASLGKKTWDYEDRRRVTIQRNSITRVRPAMLAGWQAEFQLLVSLPEYIPADVLHEVLNLAGRTIGVGDYRPSHGRFHVVSFNLGLET